MPRLIDADALISSVLKKAIDDAFLNGNTDMHRLLIQVIAHQPTIDAEPVRHGRWREYPSADGLNQCSECGVLRFGDSNYCPNCGADMRGKKNERNKDKDFR